MRETAVITVVADSPANITQDSATIVLTSESGPPGPPGPAGSGVLFFHYEQPTVLNPWSVTHNLGYFPSLGRCEDSAGTGHRPTVIHIDTNNLELHFVGPTDGVADFS